MTNEKVFVIIYGSVWANACKDEIAAMAQLVEHILGKDEVPGPNPGSSSRHPRCSNECRGFGFYRSLKRESRMLYNNLSGYLKKKYGTRLKKICVDGGFSCPNRDGTVGVGGCVFCSERGSGEHIEADVSIRCQVEKALASASDDDKFIVYFQNFTNTYADVSTLKVRYDAALIDKRIKILAIGTRPDCINDDIAELIASYKSVCDVWVELGLQTANDECAKRINRGYESSVYVAAMDILKRHKIDTVTHIMIGLPGEGEEELRETLSLVNQVGTWGIKIHSVYVAEGTRLAKMYRSGEYSPIGLDTYAKRAAFVLAGISPDAVVHRITGDCPKDMLVAPEWNSDKNKVIEKINEELKAKGLCQGSCYAKAK